MASVPLQQIQEISIEALERDWRSPKRRAGTLMVGLVVLGVVVVLYIVALFEMTDFLRRLRDGIPVAEADRLAVLAWYDQVRAWFLVVSVSVVITFLVWNYRVSANLSVLCLQRRFSTTWALWCWFIPIVNLFKPYQAMKEIWEESHPQSLHYEDGRWQASPVRVSRLFGFWWAFWLITLFCYWITRPFTRAAATTLEEAISQSIGIYEYTILGLVFLLLAGLFLAVMVIQITRNQERKHRAILEQESDCDGLVSATS